MSARWSEGRIQQAFTRKALQPMQSALSTASPSTACDGRHPGSLGPTAEELQNGLCLFAANPGGRPATSSARRWSVSQEVMRP